MKAFLMYNDRDFDPKQLLSRKDRFRGRSSVRIEDLLPWNERDIAQDLGLDIIWKTMAGDDPFLFDVANVAMLSGLEDPDAIAYRHRVFSDCLNNSDTVKEMYAVVMEAIETEKKNILFFRYPTGILSRSVDALEAFVISLKKLRAIADRCAGQFDSDGFSRLFAMLKTELSDEYFSSVEAHLKILKFRSGVLISAELGRGGVGKNYILRKPPEGKQGLFARIRGTLPESYTFQLNPRDDVGHEVLSKLNDISVGSVANAAAQSTDHILGFFQMLRTELAFYIGCLNLYARLGELEEPICTPIAAPLGTRQLSFSGLYDVSLALHAGRKIVGNDLKADNKDMVIITGANTGGKSTFLRSVGIAQLMMQSGMLVPAESFSSEVCASVFTHYKREEDNWMESGKWDEELGRMSKIIDHLKPDSLMLFNESFASTNEREGSEIANQVVKALLERHIKVFFVTHQYIFAAGFIHDEKTIFLRAERRSDGTRSFKLKNGEPLETSYGEDLYKTIFSSNKEKNQKPSTE